MVRLKVRLLVAVALAGSIGAGVSASDFDHGYSAYAEVLRQYVH